MHFRPEHQHFSQLTLPGAQWGPSWVVTIITIGLHRDLGPGPEVDAVQNCPLSSTIFLHPLLLQLHRQKICTFSISCPRLEVEI